MRDAVTGNATQHYPTLFSSASLGALRLDNRAIVSPMTRASATVDGHATAQMADYYRALARGGWGLIVNEATYIDRAYSQGYAYQPGIASQSQAEAWRPVVEAVHAEGVPILLQLFHAGAVNQGNHWVEGSIAPSPVQPLGEQIGRYRGVGKFQVPREITRAEMAEVVAAFAAAARRAVAAGFDGVEVHGANGYLPDQFLTTYTNLRTDAYGGPVGNRIRFHCEIMRAVRDAVPARHPVGVRISQTKVNDLTYVWPGGTEDSATIFAALAAAGIDFIDVSAHLGCDPVFGESESLAGLAKRFAGVTVVANGKLHEADKAEQILVKGEADFVAIAKGALADPAWPRKIAAGEAPVSFTPDMISPLATLDNAAAWRLQHGHSA
jgi:2,4-dienoyl-CoA reductase-like NADH-dependent reductase (Old Yellow Enzyme family)